MSLPPSPSCPLTQSHPTSSGLLGPYHPNRSDSSPCPLSGLGLRELPAGRLTPSPLELRSVTPGRLAVWLVSLSSLPYGPTPPFPPGPDSHRGPWSPSHWHRRPLLQPPLSWAGGQGGGVSVGGMRAWFAVLLYGIPSHVKLGL